MTPDKEQNGIFNRIVSALGGIASAIQQVASFIRAQTLSHTHTGGTDGQQLANAGIASNAAIAMTKLANFTAWTTYVPVWTGGSPAVGNGYLLGSYMRIGDLVFVNIFLQAESTTTFGSGGWSFSLPVTADYSLNDYITIGSLLILDSSAAIYYTGVTRLALPTTLVAFSHNTGGNIGQGTPITFEINDTIKMTLIYKAA